MASSAARATTPTSAPGSSRSSDSRRSDRRSQPRTTVHTPRRPRGFTLIELMVVVTLIAIGSAVVALALRDSSRSQLDNEGARLAALLESARAQARALGVSARWELASADASDGAQFRFIGLPPSIKLPNRWQHAGVAADIVGARAVRLGPEPLIGAQRIVLRLADQRLDLVTDGLGPFVADAPPAAQ